MESPSLAGSSAIADHKSFFELFREAAEVHRLIFGVLRMFKEVHELIASYRRNYIDGHWIVFVLHVIWRWDVVLHADIYRLTLLVHFKSNKLDIN